MANKEKIKKGAKKVYSTLNEPGAVIAYKAGKKVYEKGREHGFRLDIEFLARR